MPIIKGRLKIILIAVAIILGVSLIAIYTGLWDYFIQSWSDSDFRSGVFAEIHGVVIETLLVVGLLTWLIERRERKRWRPARLLLARHICRVHQMMFSSFRYVIDPEIHISMEGRGFPLGTTQRQADAWAKEHQTKHLDYHFDELKKMIEYNNVALDSELQPLAVTYIVAAKNLLSTCKFVVDAYKDVNNRPYHGSFNSGDVVEMDRIYNMLLRKYPEIKELEVPIGPAPENSEKIIDLVNLSNKICEHIQLRIKERAGT